MKNIAKYRNMFSDNSSEEDEVKLITLDSYTNQKTDIVKAELEADKIKVVTIGSGDKVIDQYPKKDSKVLSYDKVFLINNGDKGNYENEGKAFFEWVLMLAK